MKVTPYFDRLETIKGWTYNQVGKGSTPICSTDKAVALPAKLSPQDPCIQFHISYWRYNFLCSIWPPIFLSPSMRKHQEESNAPTKKSKSVAIKKVTIGSDDMLVRCNHILPDNARYVWRYLPKSESMNIAGHSFILASSILFG